MREERLSPQRHMAWILTHSLQSALHATARLEPTRELRNLGWKVTLIAVGPGGKQLIRGVEVQYVPMPDLYFVRQLLFHLRVLRLLAREVDTLDIMFFHQMSLLWLLPVKLWRVLTGRKRPLLVMDTRDLNSADGGFKTQLRVWFYDFMHKLANLWVDGQTVITPRMAELVRVPQEKLWGIWPSGVNYEQFAPARSGRSWPAPENPIHLVYVGRLHQERNLMPLCRAVKQANEEGMAFILSLVGHGPEEVALQSFAQEAAGNINIVPAVSHDKIPDLLAQAHVGVTSLPPLDNRKFEASSPIKLFEYMSAGLPILSTRNACHSDVVAEGNYTFWADGTTPADLLIPLREIWRERDRLPVKGGAAARAAQKWTWQVSAQKISNALAQGLAVGSKSSLSRVL